MPQTNIKDRLSSLYSLRKKLCEKQKNEMQLEEIRTWMNQQLKCLKALTKNENVARSEICMRIDDIVCALNVEEIDDE